MGRLTVLILLLFSPPSLVQNNSQTRTVKSIFFLSSYFVGRVCGSFPLIDEVVRKPVAPLFSSFLLHPRAPTTKRWG